MRFLLAAIFMAATLPAMAQQKPQPDGSGDPKATTCMLGEKPTDSQIPRRFCYTNAQWAQLKASYIVIGQDGHFMMAADAPPGTQIAGPDGAPLLSVNDPRNIHSHICERQYTGGPNVGTPVFNVVCNNEH
jgi:hypothetical protein